MLQTDKLIDSYDEDMRSYLESDTYKYRHKTNNKKIQAFRSTLTPEQQHDFNDLLNSLSDEYADIALSAYSQQQRYCYKEDIADEEYCR